MPVLLSSALHQQLLAEAAAAHPLECCGLLLGTADRIAAALPCANVADDPHVRFEIDPAALIAAERAARAGGPQVLGHYHSHPNGLATPSPRDAADAARDGRIWLIVASGQITAWRAVTSGVLHGAFDPIELALPAA
ncbi:proteasome lid subunit RPN8/RPN11 [Blastomonas natatoria]|uniref:Proteasome lid subunit RPN8/RPN11 n=1 Tax=Blastomonas natatoria TaxID=34015 RepID=A0A2V3V6Y0_9SPHN|nr:M67 family metallopeptidase [Blastomonas natatoria]PXW77582.1 proteasome lid subunit RPN8/RPN11 [Blastomonas natatoria]